MIVAWTQTPVPFVKSPANTPVGIGRRLYKRYDCTRNITPQEYESMGLLATREGPTRGFEMAVQPEEPRFVGDVV